MASEYSSSIVIDEKKLNLMKLNILKAEQNNLKTREKSNEEMVEAIRKIIADEVKKNY
ncbi:hypothetical protein [Pseudoneobacillus rhizosphaerae]|uniref:Uncharacterized protein n=1 Tax=Pseudoneobacillus rhizosphaerae TaxID=2880968 RepID=A0A9C7LAB6_9BACI|nr:hypothetical protein [Pseudoneobacillus rhizosphaerae]CAG9607743.1 hypothetical protein NEOCIP111885_01435 [Pseudoneobacillus rhizosphaerae]